MLILRLPCVHGPVASTGWSLGGCCWCGRVQVTLAACASPDVLAGTVPKLLGEWGGVYPAGKLGENIHGRLLGEGKQKEGRRTVSQEGSWPGSCCEYKAGQM